MKRRLGRTSRPALFRSLRTAHRCVAVGVALAVWTGLACAPSAAQGPAAGRVVTFTKEFPGSVPPYYSVTLRENGDAVYKTEPDDQQPIEFQVPPDVASEIFALADKLGESPDRSLESKRRVANMGQKTVELLDGGDRFATSFNHTEVPEALELLGLFERISATQQHAIRLEYLVRFDRLGVVKALLQLEIDLDNGRLVAADLLIPMLERIRTDRAIAQIAQGRAAQILGKIQAEKF
jgi:hypothetical protein